MYKSSQTTNNSKNKSQGKLENSLRQMEKKSKTYQNSQEKTKAVLKSL